MKTNNTDKLTGLYGSADCGKEVRTGVSMDEVNVFSGYNNIIELRIKYRELLEGVTESGAKELDIMYWAQKERIIFERETF